MEKITRLIASTSLAGATTFILFVFMAVLISQQHNTPPKTGDFPTVTVMQLPEEKPPVEIDRKLQPPKPMPKKAPTERVEAEPSDVNTDIIIDTGDIRIAKETTSLTGVGSMSDQEARPVVRVNPQYPIHAARDGIEGWVKLSFDINEIGEVVNINVLDAVPKKVFNKAARKALRKWKYRAKIIDGKPVYQRNLSVQLDFNMSQEV